MHANATVSVDYSLFVVDYYYYYIFFFISSRAGYSCVGCMYSNKANQKTKKHKNQKEEKHTQKCLGFC